MARGSDMRAGFHAVCALAFLATPFTLPAAPAQTPVVSWVQRYSHAADSDDFAHVVVTDPAGNVFVVGGIDDRITSQDLVIIKYSGAGVALWTNRYDGPGNGVEIAGAAAVDGSGNVFVVGSSPDTNGLPDYVTVAYSGAGVPLWTNRYDGLGFGYDEVAAVAVDLIGNVFVTGLSQDASGFFQYATVAYSGAGVPLWSNLYNDQGIFDHLATAVAVDGFGNVFVTGYSFAEGSSYDYATVAYSGAGVPLWTNRFDGPGNLEDQAAAVAVDASGAVFVTGWSVSAADPTHNFNYATIKYSGSGEPLWTNLFNGTGNFDDVARAVAVDGSGNVFVTGESLSEESSWDYATVAYSGTGVPLWTNRFNGPGNSEDLPRAVAVDHNGNVFVTGQSYASDFLNSDYATIAYSGTGVPLWTNRFNGTGNNVDEARSVAVDASGNVFVTGHGQTSGVNYDSATVAYSGAGVPLWTNRFSSTGNSDDSPYALAVGGNGNVFVTGHSIGIGTSYDYATVAYSDAGKPLWTNRYDGPFNGGDIAHALAVDGSGNVIVTGLSTGIGGSYDYATVAYSGAGAPLWTNRYDGPENSQDVAAAVAVDGSGNVFVTGWSSTSGSGADFATVAYSREGVPLWTNRYNGPVNNDDAANTVAVDGSGNVFVTGWSTGNGGFRDYATVAYSGEGVPLWTNRFDGPAHREDYASALAVDGSGHVVVTGGSFGITGTSDYVTLAYSGAGVPLWTNRYDGPGNSEDLTRAMAVDTQGNVFVTGLSWNRGPDSFDIATVAYSAVGVPLWTNRHSGFAAAMAVAVDLSGNVFVTGQSWSDGTGDYVTLAYSGAGVPLWTNRYNGPANGDDWPETRFCLAIGPDGAVYVTGSSDGNYTEGVTYDYATIRYSPLLVPLHHKISANQLVLSWTDSAYRLQSAPAVHGDYADVPGATSPYITSFSDAQRFFRLKAD